MTATNPAFTIGTEKEYLLVGAENPDDVQGRVRPSPWISVVTSTTEARRSV